MIFSTFGVAPALAEGPEPWPDFTFKRVGIPEPGQRGPRITVQVDPVAPAPEAPAVPRAEGPALPASGWDWFWSTVQTESTQGGAQNMARALAALDGREALPQPRLQHLQDIAAAHGAAILRATVGTDVSPALVVAVIAVESSGHSGAQSDKGAQGLMQLIPATAARFGVEDATDPAQNIAGGVKYLSWLLGHFDRDVILALAGYNAGENAVRKYAGVPPYPETRAYVPRVLAAWQVARGLCLTRPELITDGCVFAVREASNG
ncbi:lytic transglycosylase domain-containing protein [Aliiroseovarius sp.]|uniref:lytic transglycosylase domain-containing protein n=1 Tax=Aliiroseovarius sp. TaxID=1872442 RepID=UPI00262BA73C|nr:lytic transglycosylase domain-containing protein [Aliiroseovarius sp.]